MNTKQFLNTLGLTLICMIGLSFLGMWLWSHPSPSNAGAFAPQSPIPFPPIGNPELDLEVSVDNASPQIGDEIIYTLSYANVIPGSQGFKVRLYDFLPAGVQYLSSTPEADAYTNNILLFTADSIGPTPDRVEVDVRVRVLEGYSKLRNHALVMANGVTPALDSLLTGVIQPPAWLRLVKTGYSAVLVNDELVYTLMCENTGDIIVNEVTLVDVLPTGLPLQGAAPMPDRVTLPLLTWSLGNMAPGERRTVVVTTTAPSSAGVITNTALLDAQQRVVTQTVWATQVITQGAILRVHKTGSSPTVRLGDELVYTLRYENAGNIPATGVWLTDTFPADISVNAAVPPPYELIGQQGVWGLSGTLNVDQKGKIVITTTVGGQINKTLLNVADITGQAGSFPGHAWLETRVLPFLLYIPVMTQDYDNNG